MPIQTTIRDNGSTTKLIRTLMRMNREDTKILNKDEERALISKYRDNLEELRRQLIMHNIRLVFAQCKKYAFSAKSFDDLVGRCLYGLCYAASKFDPDKNIKFTTYATPWIYKAAYEYDWATRREVKDPMLNPTSIDQLIGDIAHSSKSDGSSATVENIINSQIDGNWNQVIPQTDVAVSANEQNQIVEQLRQYLTEDSSFSETDAEILNRRFFENQSYKKISVDLDIPMKTVRQREATMLSKFRDFLHTSMNVNSYQDIAKNSEKEIMV